MKAVVVAAFVSALAAPAAAADPTAPELPTGRLQGISMGRGGGWFLVLDQSKKIGETADLWSLLVMDPPYPSNGREVVYSLAHQRIDCPARTVTELGVYGYDAEGEVVVTLPESPTEPIEPRSAHEFMARVLCDGERPPTPTVTGYAQARRTVQAINAR